MPDNELREFFDSGVEYWESKNTPARREFLKRALLSWLHNPMGKLLDIGCGTGIVSSMLVESGYPTTNIILLDISEKMLRSAKTHIDSVNCVQTSAENMPIQNNSIDRVIIFDALPHLNVNKLLSALRVIMKPRGELIILHDNCHCGINSIHQKVGKPVISHKLAPISIMVKKLRDAGFFSIRYCEIPQCFYYIFAVKELE